MRGVVTASPMLWRSSRHSASIRSALTVCEALGYAKQHESKGGRAEPAVEVRGWQMFSVKGQMLISSALCPHRVCASYSTLRLGVDAAANGTWMSEVVSPKLYELECDRPMTSTCHKVLFLLGYFSSI